MPASLLRSLFCLLSVAGFALLTAGISRPVRASEPPPPAVAEERLIVSVTGLRNTRGNVVVSLFRGGEGFPDDATRALASRIVAAASPTADAPGTAAVRIPFEGLAPGDYAVVLFHDENANGKLDTRWGIPTEGFGVSNHPRLRWGAPTYREARFALVTTANHETTITIPVRYLKGLR